MPGAPSSPASSNHCLSPAFAAATAQMLARWQRAQFVFGPAGGDRAYLIDLAPGRGAAALRLLAALQQEYAGDAGPDWCYVAMCTKTSAARRLWEEPLLDYARRHGRFTVMVWNPRQESPPTPYADATRPDFMQALLPPLLLANGAFGQLPWRLYAIHYGKAFHVDTHHASSRLRACKPLQDSTGDGRVDRLLAGYRNSLNSAPVSVPVGPLAAIDAIESWTGRRVAVLANDRGIHDLASIRLGAYRRPDNQQAALPLVNFHALASEAESAGHQAWAWPTPGMDEVTYLSLPATTCRQNSLPTIVAPLAQAALQHLPATLVATSMAARTAPAVALTLWRGSGHDPALLPALQPHLQQVAEDRTGAASSRQWRDELNTALLAAALTEDEAAALGIIAELALQSGHWGLARRAILRRLELNGRSPEALACLASCDAATGLTRSALQAFEELAARQPDHAIYIRFRNLLRERLAKWSALPWFDGAPPHHNGLTLEPISDFHLPQLLWQYRDPQIGAMTGLPPMPDLPAANAWLDAQNQEQGRMTFAAVHQDFGLIGVVSLRRHDDLAQFHFWIGVDYQDRGFGRRAAALLFEYATQVGIRQIFTSVYPDNTRSRRALLTLGFQAVKARAQPPHDQLEFWGRGQSPLDARNLIRLYTELDSRYVFIGAKPATSTVPASSQPCLTAA